MRRREAVLCIHPGEVLKEEFLVPHRVSASRLAAAVGVPPSRIYGILHGRRSITAELAILLAHAFQTTPEFWMALQAHYDLQIAKSGSPIRRAEKLAMSHHSASRR
jgi:addiction module HigA family antidote